MVVPHVAVFLKNFTDKLICWNDVIWVKVLFNKFQSLRMSFYIFRVVIVFIRYFSYNFHEWISFFSSTWLSQYAATCTFIHRLVSWEASRDCLLQRFSEWRSWYSVILDCVLVNCCVSERTDWLSAVIIDLIGFVFISWSLCSVEPWWGCWVGPVCEIVWHPVCSHYNGLIFFIVNY